MDITSGQAILGVNQKSDPPEDGFAVAKVSRLCPSATACQGIQKLVSIRVHPSRRRLARRWIRG